MGVYLRGKSYYYNFYYEGKRYNEKIGQVSKSVAQEKLNIKRSEVIRGGMEAEGRQDFIRQVQGAIP